MKHIKHTSKTRVTRANCTNQELLNKLICRLVPNKDKCTEE